VDSGFSFTHAAPVFQNRVVSGAVKRINLGGKALTNYLKELVSYRAWNVMDETYIMEDVKEKLCFCSLDIVRDLTIARSVYSPGLFWSPCILMGLNSFRSVLAVPELLGL
jgi:actin-related protein 6